MRSVFAFPGLLRQDLFYCDSSPCIFLRTADNLRFLPPREVPMQFLLHTLRSAVVCLAGTRIRTATLFSLAILALPILGASTAVPAVDQNAQAAGPNSDPTYQALRNLALGGEAVSISNFDLKRDAGTFHLRSGMVCFVAPVQGKVTGAVFVGDGNFVLDPPSASERSSLKLLTKSDEFSEQFERLVLRFTDTTYDDIKRGGSVVSTGCAPSSLRR